jgi:dTDP-4-amino-4,6-dideoxygalactose transaminase
LTWERHRGHAHSYDVVALGNNYRIDEIRSAIGLAQLHKLDRNNARRKEITQAYQAGLSQLEVHGVELPFIDHPGQPSYHIFPFILPEEADRGVFIDSMRSQGVQTSIHYPPIHTFSYYRQKYPGLSLPVTEAVAAREVTLPLYPTMKDEHVDYVLSAVQVALQTAVMDVVSGRAVAN